ncbi:hypothetical protein [Bacteroides sp.]|uniref:hypothetical protein n=1 Tax=Bacteroides sp. TaxID=29523 RepID=UPI002621AAB1|nr:hypothetical protein [Bacteroides sp.]
MADIKENGMGSGTPAKVRALDSVGNSITTTPDSLAKITGCLRRNNLYGNSADGALYSKIATMSAPADGEGIENSLSLLISGGNEYTGPATITILSICVYRGSVKAAKNGLIGNQEVGYVYANKILSIWVKRSQFTHYTNVIVLSEKGNDVIASNEVASSIPNGYVII